MAAYRWPSRIIGHLTGVMDFALLGALPQRMFGVMTNEVLLAIPLFIFMGVMLERSAIAEDLLETMGRLFGSLTGGLAIAVLIVGVLLAAAKGIVGATTVTMGLIVLPTMLRHGYDPRLAAGTVAATATLAQIFPPATVLVLLGDQMSNAYQAAQLSQGTFAPQSVNVADLFAGAIIPAFALVALYLLYLIGVATSFRIPRRRFRPIPARRAALRSLADWRGCWSRRSCSSWRCSARSSPALRRRPKPPRSARSGRWLLAAVKLPSFGFADVLGPVVARTTQITCMIFVILIGATMFSLVFRGLGGDDLVHRALGDLPGGAAGAILVVMIGMFLLGFVMDAFEIIFVVVPIVAPALLKLPGVDPVWLGIMMAMNLQTSYIHPPLGPTLFFLRGVAPPEITTRHIYVGIIPFVLIQLLALVMLWFAPGLATWLPHKLYGP